MRSLDFPSRPSILPDELKGALLLPADQEPCSVDGQSPTGWASRCWKSSCPARLKRPDGLLTLGSVGSGRGVYLHAVVVPVAVLLGVIVWGTSRRSCTDGFACQPQAPGTLSTLLLAVVGPFLPLLALTVRLSVLPFRQLQTCWMLAVWFLTALLRLVVYSTWMESSGLFSDRIFLITSVTATLQMELSLVHEQISRSWESWLALSTDWMLLCFLYMEAYTTAYFYDRASQTWCSALLGIPLFNIISLSYIYHVRHTKKKCVQIRYAFQENGMLYTPRGGPPTRAAPTSLKQGVFAPRAEPSEPPPLPPPLEPPLAASLGPAASSSAQAADEGLPAGWKLHYNQKTGRTLYQDPSGNVQWQHPLTGKPAASSSQAALGGHPVGPGDQDSDPQQEPRPAAGDSSAPAAQEESPADGENSAPAAQKGPSPSLPLPKGPAPAARGAKKGSSSPWKGQALQRSAKALKCGPMCGAKQVSDEEKP